MLNKIKIGNVEINNNIFLAPMAGITDMPYRSICKDFGAGLTYSEMVSAKGLIYKDKKTHKIMDMDEGEYPKLFKYLEVMWNQWYMLQNMLNLLQIL